MSTEIEQRVVEMQFDNKQFERNVSTTMSSLDKLKQSLNLTGAAKGLENVGNAAKGIHLSGLTTAAETVSLKFNAMYSTVDQIFRNLVTRAQYTGERMASALTIDPIKTGFAEYETQINAVQTILANTKSKGTNIGDVNAALDELNTYADKTIYNFTEMTRNIGTFTAAGVDLDKSVTSIKGIANLAAVSGSTSQQASTAMYQLSQALAAGKVQLMDWNSVVNAGMGGEVFQEALKRTAKNMGTDVDAMIKKYGSFRESLTRGEWLTADVLTETLTQLSGAYTEADLLAKGYTKEQAADILDLAQTAEDAATKVKTFTQLWDTLKESAQSGWTQTWEILVGDFEEAKEMLTKVSDVIGKMIGKSAEARNNLLQGWKDAGGRDDLLKGFVNIFDALMRVIRPITAAFKEIFPPVTVDQLLKFTEGFKNFTENLKLSSPNIAKLKTTFKGIFSVLDIGWTVIKDLAGGVVKLIGHFTGLGGGILDITSKIGGWLLGLRDTVKETDYFGKAVDGIVSFLGGAIDKLKEFGGAIKTAFQSASAEGLFQFLRGIWDAIVKIGSRIGEIFAPLTKAFANLFTNGNLSGMLNDGIFAAVLVGIYKFVDNLNGPLGSIKDLFEGLSGEDGIIGGLKETLDSVRGCFEAYQNSLKADILKKIAVSIAILAGSLFVISSIDGAALDRSLGAVGVLFAELMASLAIFTKMDLGNKGLVKGVTAITALAGALLILSGAMKIMSTINGDEMAIAITGICAGLFALVTAVNFLPEGRVNKTAKAVRTLSTALLILAGAMKIMASMNGDEMAIAITGIAGGLFSLVTAVNLLPKDTGLRSLGMVGLATSMVILGGALKLMATMSWDEIGRGLGSMGIALLTITAAIDLMPKDAALRSAGMMGLAAAMVILGGAMKLMATMSWDEIGRGFTVMGGALLGLAIALNFMNGTLAGSAALLVAAGALAILTPVLKTLGGMSLTEICNALVALAGAFLVIGMGGMALGPLVPVLLSIAGAMAAFGGATLAFGLGIAAISWGFTTLAAAGAAGATAFIATLGALTVGLIGLIPSIVRVITEMVVALCDAVITIAPKLADTLLIVISEVMASLATYTPQIVDSLLQFLIGILDSLATHMPQLIQSAVDVIGAFFTGIVDALSGIDTDALLKGIAGAGLLAGLIFALSALTPMIPGAITGVIGMGIIVAELAAVLAAIGLLAQIPGLDWLIGEGGDLLQTIGTAIGQFVGGILGGIAEGATSTLPQIGTNLSAFMTNLQPFIDGIAGLDTTMLDNAKTLAGVILALTAADLLNGITSFFKGDTSLKDFGTELSAFGKSMKQYSTEVAGIDTESVSASVAAAKDLVKMAGEIPSDGLFGTDGIDDFGKNLVTFGKKMKQYGDEVKDIDATPITASVSAAKGLVNVAKQIPDDGSFGTDGIDDFGKNIVSFAKSIKKYADKIADVSLDSISKSVAIVHNLIGVITRMAGMDASGVKSFTTALNDLSKANFDGFVETFATSATKLTNVGKNMFSSIIEGAKSMRSRFVALARTTMTLTLDAINGMGARFKVAGIDTISKFINGVLSGKPRVSSAFGSALSTALATVKGYYSSFYSAAAYLVTGFANGISANRYKAAAQARAMAAAAASAARKELDEHSPSKVGYGIGDFFGIGFVNAIADNVKNAYNTSAKMANAAESGLKGAFDRVSRIINGEVEISPTVRPVVDLTNVRSSANAINGMFGLQPSVGVLANVGAVSSMMNQRGQNGGADEIVSAIGKLEKALGNVGNTTNYFSGLNYTDTDGKFNEALGVIVRALLMGGRV